MHALKKRWKGKENVERKNDTKMGTEEKKKRKKATPSNRCSWPIMLAINIICFNSHNIIIIINGQTLPFSISKYWDIIIL